MAYLKQKTSMLNKIRKLIFLVKNIKCFSHHYTLQIAEDLYKLQQSFVENV